MSHLAKLTLKAVQRANQKDPALVRRGKLLAGIRAPKSQALHGQKNGHATQPLIEFEIFVKQQNVGGFWSCAHRKSVVSHDCLLSGQGGCRPEKGSSRAREVQDLLVDLPPYKTAGN